MAASPARRSIGSALRTRAEASASSDRLSTALRNRKKIRRLQAGATDERAVDICHRHQLGRIGRLHRTAIEDAHPGPFPVEAFDQQLPDKRMNLLDILGGWRQ